MAEQFIDFDAVINDKELLKLKKIKGDLDDGVMIGNQCEECGCVVGHRMYVCNKECCYCTRFHPGRLCIRRFVICPVCNDPYDTLPSQHQTCKSLMEYREKCFDIACSESSSIYCLIPDLIKLIKRHTIFGPPVGNEICCRDKTMSPDCGHCFIATKICKSRNHCGCGKVGHIFTIDHYCRECKIYGHWTQLCPLKKKRKPRRLQF